MSHNPFRKARDQQIELPTADAATVAGIFDYRESHREQDVKAEQQQTTTKSGKPKKKVVIKTPPRSPEEPHRRLSLGFPASPKPSAEDLALRQYGDVQGGFTAANTHLQEVEYNDRWNSIDSGSASSSEMMANGQRDDVVGAQVGKTPPAQDTGASLPTVRAPVNPFAKTLATSEDKHALDVDQSETAPAVKPAFDIDTFKNILLNGATPPVIPRPQAAAVSTENEVTNSFDSRFPSLSQAEAQQFPEHPTIIEDRDTSSGDETEEERIVDTPTPQPVSGPQTVAFDELQSTLSSNSPVNGISTEQSEVFHDNEKPLPALPVNESKHNLPPAPPVARRQAQITPSEGRRRSSSIMSRSSMQSDTSSVFSQPTPNSENARAPPPPPSRRSLQSKSATATPPDNETTASSERANMLPPPAPAPRRGPSKAVRGDGRTSSAPSRPALSALSESGSSGMIPPRPPPRRAGESTRSSLDDSTSRRLSGQDSRRTSSELTRQETPRSQADLLSDLAALQREVDELRAKAGTG